MRVEALLLVCLLAVTTRTWGYTNSALAIFGTGLSRSQILVSKNTHRSLTATSLHVSMQTSHKTSCTEAKLPQLFGIGMFAPILAASLFSAVPDAQAFVDVPDLSATPLAKSSANIIVEGNARVVDGDTLVIEDGKGGKERIRLLGIDAPESKQTCKDNKGGQYQCGLESQQALQKLVGNDKVKCIANKRDMYQRVLGVCYDERTGVELNREMINEGEAIAYTAYSKAYTPQESDAKNKKLGVWKGEFQEPWEYRKAKRLANKQVKEARDFVKDAKKAQQAKAQPAASVEVDDAELEE